MVRVVQNREFAITTAKNDLESRPLVDDSDEWHKVDGNGCLERLIVGQFVGIGSTADLITELIALVVRGAKDRNLWQCALVDSDAKERI